MMNYLLFLLIGLHSLECPPDTTEYEGECVPSSCLFDGTLCGGHGTCDDYGVCNCDEGYSPTHSGCQPKACVDGTLLCNGHGKCSEQSNGRYKCDCDTGYELYNSAYYCVPEICITGSWLCNDHGICIIDDQDGPYCKCDDTTEGDQCEICAKRGVLIDDVCVYDECVTTYPDGTQDECGGAGLCMSYDWSYICRCDPFDSITLGPFTCISNDCVSDNLSEGVCSRHGYCKARQCICDEGYSGKLCEITTLDCEEDETLVNGVCYPTACLTNYTESDVVLCSGIGTCNFRRKECKCPTEYAGDQCEMCSSGATRVDGACVDNACITDEPDGSISVCNGHGKCVQSESGSVRCRCSKGYGQLDTLTCVSRHCISTNSIVCGHHGVCVNDACQCDDGFSGEYCEDYDNCPANQQYVLGYCVPDVCVTTYSDGQKAICGGYGHCVEKEDGPTCECIKDGRFINGACVSEKCITDTSNDTVCSNNGQCKGGICDCKSGYKPHTCA
ncbi:Tenascin precursor [Giardia duodenalis assemblage B]|uniref:Tenascin n=1 Tax=Giardia duodenalis assemblage B TaxID=1394984 RepID=A0A132NYY5_GIAIN|nr:Tenascin precursor [Giardia intestinalis assemblage B]